MHALKHTRQIQHTQTRAQTTQANTDILTLHTKHMHFIKIIHMNTQIYINMEI